jgi:uncharacterized membrane protein
MGFKPCAFWLIAGTGFYIFGTVVVTGVFNVPRNDALAAVDPASPDAAKLWADYLVTWTLWNHVRTIAALIAAASLTIGLWLSRLSETIR